MRPVAVILYYHQKWPSNCN